MHLFGYKIQDQLPTLYPKGYYYDERGKRLNDNFKRTLELLTDDGKYNYVAYLLADENGNSIKVAKYSSLDRCDLIENNEYGYCSLIKSTKSVLSKLDIENKVALREAVINAVVHNDYSFEVPPKFEIFPDRLEITSAGRLPESLTREEFFNGISIPRILRAYGEDCFKFTDNFIRITLPISSHDHASLQVENLVSILTGEMGRAELQELLFIKNKFCICDYFSEIFFSLQLS